MCFSSYLHTKEYHFVSCLLHSFFFSKYHFVSCLLHSFFFSKLCAFLQSYRHCCGDELRKNMYSLANVYRESLSSYVWIKLFGTEAELRKLRTKSYQWRNTPGSIFSYRVKTNLVCLCTSQNCIYSRHWLVLD